MTDAIPPPEQDLGPSPFHAGEIALQQRVGVHERVEQMGRRMIRDHLVEQHREFFALLPTLLVAGVDESLMPWATMLAGPPGFITAPDQWHLHIAARPADDDPVAASITAGAPLGLLGLEPQTRRRNRMNGTVVSCDAGGFTVKVVQSFGNCPKYIQAREPRWRVESSAKTPPTYGGAVLDAACVARIRAADTFFVASRSADPLNLTATSAGLDISHRGGKPGFVRIDEEHGQSVLVIPDFVGNFLFNTLGNLLLNPACGLLFVDYAEGGLLHLGGTAELVHEGEDVARFSGAERAWRLRVAHSLWRPRALPVTWSAAELAPQLPNTGEWLPT